jgi:hypothetical protein
MLAHKRLPCRVQTVELSRHVETTLDHVDLQNSNGVSAGVGRYCICMLLLVAIDWRREHGNLAPLAGSCIIGKGGCQIWLPLRKAGANRNVENICEE